MAKSKQQKQIQRKNSFPHSTPHACRTLQDKLITLKPGQSLAFFGRVENPNPEPTNDLKLLSGRVTLRYEQQVNCNSENTYNIENEDGESMFLVFRNSDPIYLGISPDNTSEPYVQMREANTENNLRFFPHETAFSPDFPPVLHGSSIRFPHSDYESGRSLRKAS